MTSDRAMDMKSQVRRLAQNAMALTAGGIVAQLVFTLVEVLIARKLGAASYGVFVTAYAWSVLGSIAMGLGTGMWTVQEGSRDHARIPALFGASLSVLGVGFALLYLGVLAAHALFPGNAVVALLLLLLPYGLILGLQTTLASVYSCYQTMAINGLFQGAAPLGILVVWLLLPRDGISLEHVGFAYVIGGAAVTAGWLAFTLKRVRPKFELAATLDVLKRSNQYAISNLLSQIYFRTDVVMLSAIGGIREAGIYAAAYKLVELVSKTAVVAGRVFAPAIFKASHEPGKAYRVFSSMMTRFMAIAGLVAGVTAFILADELIELLFGESFVASASVLRILGGVMATRCMMVPLQLLLSSADLHFRRVAALGTVVAANIAANAILIPLYGAEGAAWAALLSGALLITLYAVSSSGRRELEFRRWLLTPTIIAAAIAGLAVVTDINAFALAPLAVAIFLIGLILVGFVRGDEILFVLRSLLARGSR
ncbi:MAG TPA: oligosaccharide flippase family protein [Woeseiaceae bacterium]